MAVRNNVTFVHDSGNSCDRIVVWLLFFFVALRIVFSCAYDEVEEKLLMYAAV